MIYYGRLCSKDSRKHGELYSVDRPCDTITTVGIGGAGAGGGDWYWLRSDEPDGERDMTKPPYKVPLMSEIANRPWNGFKVCSTFSGCGGSSLGYKMAGFRVLWANEFIPEAQNTYEENHPRTVLDRRDIRDISAVEVLARCGLEQGELDLLDGSPPCKDFSLAGNRDWQGGKVKKYSDTEQRTDDLFDNFIRLLRGIQPKTFVAENVYGMTVGDAKEFLGDFQRDMFQDQSNTVLDMMMDAGYVVEWRILNAANLGVPQNRRRIIFVGVRRDLAKKHALRPAFPESLPYQYTIRDAIPWVSENGAGNAEPESDLTKYSTGAEWERLAVGEQSEKYFNLVKSDPEKPSPTICASHGSGGIASVAHPFEKRKWSIAELRRLCGFPDDFILTGSYAKQWERLGRAVPPVMMSKIAEAVRRDILSKIKLT